MTDNELLESELLQLAQELSDREEALSKEVDEKVEAQLAKRIAELDAREQFVKEEEARIKTDLQELFIERGRFNLDKAAYVKANAPAPAIIVHEKTEEEKVAQLLGSLPNAQHKPCKVLSVTDLLAKMKVDARRA